MVADSRVSNTPVIFLSTFAGHLYDRMGFQNTYLVLGGIVLAVTVLSAFTLSSTRKTAAPSAETATAQTEVRL
ncbi:MFS transporter [Escherichia sp. HC-CC]